MLDVNSFLLGVCEYKRIKEYTGPTCAFVCMCAVFVSLPEHDRISCAAAAVADILKQLWRRHTRIGTSTAAAAVVAAMLPAVDGRRASGPG